MAKDNILPGIFAQTDDMGNLIHGLKISGVCMTVVATLVPFAHLNDLISSGILIAFTITDASVILVRQKSPSDRPTLLKSLLGMYVVTSLLSGFLLRSWLSFGVTSVVIRAGAIFSCLAILALGYLVATRCEHVEQSGNGLFLTPFVPYLPLGGILINNSLISQLEPSGLLMISGYIGLTIGSYWYSKAVK